MKYLLFFLFLVSSATSDLENDAKIFLAEVNEVMGELGAKESTLYFQWATNITDYNNQLAIDASQVSMGYTSGFIKNASVAFPNSVLDQLSEESQRMLNLLKMVTIPPLSDTDENVELVTIVNDMEGTYSKGTVCVNSVCGQTLEDISKTMAVSRNYDVLLQIWENWRKISTTQKSSYSRFVTLSNKGAKEIGFKDTGDLWLSRYDMTTKEVIKDVEKAWEQVKPLYEQLHCYVRGKLKQLYGESKFSSDGTIPAHLLGNMWGQDWTNLYNELQPFPEAGTQDITQKLVEMGWDWRDIVQQTESFFTSLGLQKLPQNFWDNSMFVKPQDREVVCHASAWDLGTEDNVTQVRLKMCMNINQEDFITVHHELGHIWYYLNYANLPTLYRSGANDGFHEGIGDTMALSVTPNYLEKLGLLPEQEDSDESTLNQLMLRGLEKIAFLPFGLLIDKWRWRVFSGETTLDEYNSDWWALRKELQGMSPPQESPDRTELFDPAAKYHICSNTPYLRYFLSYILQFQFHKALCSVAGHTGPLHECSINGSVEAGTKLKEMLAKGQSQKWQKTLEEFTGSPDLDASVLLDYFEPLAKWLEKTNKENNWTVGWDTDDSTDDDDDNLSSKEYELLLIGVLLGALCCGPTIGIAIAALWKKKFGTSYTEEGEVQYETVEMVSVGDADNKTETTAKRSRSTSLGAVDLQFAGNDDELEVPASTTEWNEDDDLLDP